MSPDSYGSRISTKNQHQIISQLIDLLGYLLASFQAQEYQQHITFPYRRKQRMQADIYIDNMVTGSNHSQNTNHLYNEIGTNLETCQLTLEIRKSIAKNS